MHDELLHYYERELAFLRQMGADFAAKYPKVASRLMMEPDKCEDPHVERLLEAFAFLAARVHLKIDDDFPEISESLLDIVYPHYLRPIPSMSVVHFAVTAQKGKMTAAARVPKGSTLLSKPVGGVPCKFTTCYETDVLPMEVTAANGGRPTGSNRRSRRWTRWVRSASACAASRRVFQGAEAEDASVLSER